MHDPCPLRMLMSTPAYFTHPIRVGRSITPGILALESVAGCIDTFRVSRMGAVKPMTINHDGLGGREVAGRQRTS